LRIKLKPKKGPFALRLSLRLRENEHEPEVWRFPGRHTFRAR